MSDQIIPFAFDSSLVRIVIRDGEPWFFLTDVCKVLEHSNASAAASRLEADEKMTLNNDEGHSGQRGGAQSFIVINESGLYSLIFTSRKPEAKRFRKWVTAEVLPSIRKTGRYEDPGRVPPMDGPVMALNANLAALREYRLLFGPARARELWSELGLPGAAIVEPRAAGLEGEGAACLAHLLGSVLDSGARVADLLSAARAYDGAAERKLSRHGFLVTRAFGGGVWVANRHPSLADLFAGSPWSDGRWRAALRLVPGASAARSHNRHRFDGHQARAVFVPWSAIDIDSKEESAYD